MTQGPSVTVRQVGPSTGEGQARGHTLLVDRPEEKGGLDRGPMGGELILVGLGGCFMSNILAAVVERSASVSDVQLKVSAVAEGSPLRMTSFGIEVSARCDDPELLEKLATIAARGCIAVNTMRQGSPVTVSVSSGGSA